MFGVFFWFYDIVFDILISYRNHKGHNESDKAPHSDHSDDFKQRTYGEFRSNEQ